MRLFLTNLYFFTLLTLSSCGSPVSAPIDNSESDKNLEPLASSQLNVSNEQEQARALANTKDDTTLTAASAELALYLDYRTLDEDKKPALYRSGCVDFPAPETVLGEAFCADDTATVSRPLLAAHLRLACSLTGIVRQPTADLGLDCGAAKLRLALRKTSPNLCLRSKHSACI